jgi:hypothetical protein
MQIVTMVIEIAFALSAAGFMVVMAGQAMNTAKVKARRK